MIDSQKIHYLGFCMFKLLNHLHEVRLVSFSLIYSSLQNSNIKQNVEPNQSLYLLIILKIIINLILYILQYHAKAFLAHLLSLVFSNNFIHHKNLLF